MQDKLIFVEGDDWQGLFHNGVLIHEEHEIRKSDLVKWMKKYNTFDVKFTWLNNFGLKWLADIGSFPANYSEIPASYLE